MGGRDLGQICFGLGRGHVESEKESHCLSKRVDAGWSPLHATRDPINCPPFLLQSTHHKSLSLALQAPARLSCSASVLLTVQCAQPASFSRVRLGCRLRVLLLQCNNGQACAGAHAAAAGVPVPPYRRGAGRAVPPPEGPGSPAAGRRHPRRPRRRQARSVGRHWCVLRRARDLRIDPEFP
jgi:hypothetical protein